ncbi:MAG TPA: hypothetical protein VF638_08420 [Sphingomonas sp.]|jgi:hypothetical protein
MIVTRHGTGPSLFREAGPVARPHAGAAKLVWSALAILTAAAVALPAFF